MNPPECILGTLPSFTNSTSCAVGESSSAQSSIRRSWARSVRPSNAEDLANKSEIMGNDKIFEYFEESLDSTENSHQFRNWHGRGQYWQRTMLIEIVCGTHKHLQGAAVLLSVIHHIGARGARLPLSVVQWTGDPIRIGNHAPPIYEFPCLLMLNVYSFPCSSYKNKNGHYLTARSKREKRFVCRNPS